MVDVSWGRGEEEKEHDHTVQQRGGVTNGKKYTHQAGSPGAYRFETSCRNRRRI